MALFCSSDDYKYAHEITINNKLIASNIKFFPPKPSYTLDSNNTDNNIDNKVDFEILPSLPYTKNNIPEWIDITLYSLQLSKKTNLVCIHIENNIQKTLLLQDEEKAKKQKRRAILYSHENNADLFIILPFLIDLSVQIKCDIVSYDYLGFGCSLGKTTEKNFLSTYQNVMDFVLNNLKYQIENILLIGRDIGAIHSIIIASRNKYKNVKGLILITPLISEKNIDINIMKSITCPTLLIEQKGTDNVKDDKENKMVLFCREITDEKEWFPKDKNIYNNKSLFYNGDILLKNRKKFIKYIKEYMKSNGTENGCTIGSGVSTNSGTSNDNCENYSEDMIDNKKDKENNKIDYVKEFEEEDNIDYNNDDY